MGAGAYGAAYRIARLPSERTSALPYFFVVAYFAALALFKGSTDHASRYLVPCLPLLLICASDGWGLLCRFFQLGRLGVAAGALGLLVGTFPLTLDQAQTYALNVASVSGHVVTMGKWLASHVPSRATLAMSDIGAMSYFTRNLVVDMRGLVSSYQGWDRLAELERQKREGVNYAILFPELNERVILRGEYVPLFGLTLRRNNISASDNLGVYRTPWTDRRRRSSVGASFDFENGTLAGWRRSGAFCRNPVRDLPAGKAPWVNLGGGQWLVSSAVAAGEDGTGWALSPEFLLEGDLMTLRIGGAQRPGELGARLWVEGRIRWTAVGDGSRLLVEREWDIRSDRGKPARLELFDQAGDPDGELAVDHIRQLRVTEGNAPTLLDFPPEGPQEPASTRERAQATGMPTGGDCRPD